MTPYRFRRRFLEPQQQYRRWIDPRVATLRLADVTAYLLRQGWTPVPADRAGFRVFEEPRRYSNGDGPYWQFVPEAEGGSDYALCMFDLLTGVAEAEDRMASAVIDDILRMSVDDGMKVAEVSSSQA